MMQAMSNLDHTRNDAVLGQVQAVYSSASDDDFLRSGSTAFWALEPNLKQCIVAHMMMTS